MMPNPYDLQRMHPRLSGQYPITWPGGLRPAVVTDLSLGGCRVATQFPTPPLGEALHVSIAFAEDDVLSATARTVWVAAGRGFGLRFERLSPEQTAQLVRALMRDGLSDPFRPPPFTGAREYDTSSGGGRR